MKEKKPTADKETWADRENGERDQAKKTGTLNRSRKADEKKEGPQNKDRHGAY